MIATFLSPSDDRWTATLADVPHDVYHRPEYVRTAAAHEGGRPVAFYARDPSGVLLLPLLIRSIPGTDEADATSPYGYPGPLWTTPAPASHWEAFHRTSRERGFVSVFVRLHPLLPSPSPRALGRPDTVALVEHGPTVWIDCTRTADALWDDTRPDHRSDIRRLRRLEYTVEIAPDRASLKGQLDTFRRLYRQTMDRVGADRFYYFSEDYFSAWTESLQPHCQIALVRAPDDTPAAAGLFTRTDGWMQYHLSGTNERYRKHAPSKLMLHRMRIQAQMSAVSHLHLGGGRGGSKDSLFSFKAGFASSRATFSSLRLVCDRVAYDALCRRDAPPISDGFFPAYRDE